MICGGMILDVVILQLLASAGHSVPATHVFGRSWLCGLFEHTCRLAADEPLSD